MSIKETQNIRDFLIENVLLKNSRRKLAPDSQRKLEYIRHGYVDKPLIYVGMNTCGKIAGAEKTFDKIAKYLKANSLDIELIEGGCSGLCSVEPLVDIQLPNRNRISFGHITYDKVQPLLDDVLKEKLPDGFAIGQYKSKSNRRWKNIPYIEDLPFFANQQKIITKMCGVIDPVSVTEYIANGGYKSFINTINQKTPSQVCSIIYQSQLQGRGGGEFPTGKKWSIALSTPSEQTYLVCNAVESDPGSYMNRHIIESMPHKLIEAVLIAAYATKATKAFIFIRKEFDLSIKRLKQALKEAYDFGLIGHNIFDSGVNINIVIKEGARAFVCGEETALNNSIEGKRAMPYTKPPYPAQRGLWNKPTVVNNVETLINVPLIMKNGADWYKKTGTKSSKGTKLFTLSGKTNNYGTFEVSMGTTFRDILNNISNGLKSNQDFKAIILGINSGNYITKEVLDKKVDFEELKTIGSTLGSGAFVVVDQNTCMVALASYFSRFFKNESCGKCIPCREGTEQLFEMFQLATTKFENQDTYKPNEIYKGIEQIIELSKVMKDTSLCELGKSAPNAFLYTIHHFKSEFESHIYERNCPANVCNID